MRRTTLLALTLVAALAACGGGDAAAPAVSSDDPTTTIAATTTTTAAGTSDTEGDPAATTVAPTTAAPTTAAPTTEPSTTVAPTTVPSTDCLVGEWVVTEAEMNAFYDAVESRVDEPIAFTIDGQAGLEFTETTYEWTPAFDLTLELGGITGSGVAGGSISGTYATNDSVLTTEVGESAMSLTIEVAGQTLDGSAIGNGFITSVPFVNSPYSCDGPTPVIMFETIDDRHPVTLTPAG